MRKILISTSLAFCFGGLWAQSDSRQFTGIYAGVVAGSQNLFGGSNINGADVLAQSSRGAVDFPLGYRRQFLSGRFLAGAEFIWGLTDGRLKHEDRARQLSIRYENNSQWSIGLTAGYVFGKKRSNLTFLYLNETTRQFDVFIVDQYGPYKQQDEQGMLKFGVGVERRLLKALHVRLTAGRLYADFGDRVTNIDVNDKWDVMGGLAYQF